MMMKVKMTEFQWPVWGTSAVRIKIQSSSGQQGEMTPDDDNEVEG